VRLYSITVTATVTDIDNLTVALSADVEIDDESMRAIAMRVMPSHLRKAADDIEAANPDPIRTRWANWKPGDPLPTTAESTTEKEN
jgi:hypothetical protein